MMATAWGVSWGDAWGDAWLLGAPVVVTTDTHDGDRQRKRHHDFKERHELLREQIRVALDGPDTEEIANELEAFAAPQVSDSLYRPLVERIDYARIREEVIAEIMARHRAIREQEILAAKEVKRRKDAKEIADLIVAQMEKQAREEDEIVIVMSLL